MAERETNLRIGDRYLTQSCVVSIAANLNNPKFRRGDDVGSARSNYLLTRRPDRINIYRTNFHHLLFAPFCPAKAAGTSCNIRVKTLLVILETDSSTSRHAG